MLAQLEGLTAGYNLVAPPDRALSYMDMLLINYIGDFGDVGKAVNPGTRVDWHTLDLNATLARSVDMEHCSGLVKVAADLSDVWVAHTTWGSYESMLRIYKTYALALADHSDCLLASCCVAAYSFQSFACLFPRALILFCAPGTSLVCAAALGCRSVRTPVCLQATTTSSSTEITCTQQHLSGYSSLAFSLCLFLSVSLPFRLRVNFH